MKPQPAILLVANWDADVGYAWWLIETFWLKISVSFSENYKCYLAYPSNSKTPEAIKNSKITPLVENFSTFQAKNILAQIKFIRKYNIQVLYLTDKPTVHWCYLLFRLAGVKKIITHDHTPGTRPQPILIKKILKTILNRTPLISVDACFGATDFVKNRLININCAPGNKCFSIPNGLPNSNEIDQHDDTVNIHEQFCLDQNAIVIVTASRAHNYKGIDFALNVIAHVRKLAPHLNIHYVFYGDGPHLENFKNTAQKLGINEFTHFPGKVANVTRYLKSCSMAFHPSMGEVGYSLSILEYMQSELPVLVPDNPSVCGATENGNTGLIYQEHNIENAAEKVIDLASNPSRMKTIGGNAKKMVRLHYTLDKTHAELIKSLKNILN